jgi:ATP-dependent Zn protease
MDGLEEAKVSNLLSFFFRIASLSFFYYTYFLFFFQGVLVFAATNRPYLLDAALMRPGRFDMVRIVTNITCNSCCYN